VRRRLEVLAVVVTACAAAACGGCGGDTAALLPVPEPALDDMEPAAREQLREARSRVERLAASADGIAVPAADLAEAYRDLGHRYQVHDLFNAAEACYRNVLALVEDDFETAYYLGIVLHQDGRLDEAVAAYERALALRPGYLPVSLRLGEIWLRREPERARTYFEAGVADPDYRASGHYGLGRVEAALRNNQAAAAHFEQALELQPGASRVHYSLGLAYRGLGERSKAESHLASYGQVDVTFPDPVLVALSGSASGAAAHARAAASAMMREQYDVAAREYVAVLESDPDDAEARRSLGTAWWRLGDLEGAVEQFREAVRLEPKNPNSLYSLGLLLTEAGDHAEAIPVLAATLEIDPESFDTQLALARALTGASRFDDAIARYRSMLATDPQSSAARFGEAGVRMRQGRHGEAERLLRDMIAADPEDVDARIELGRVLAASGRTEQALAVLEEARALDPGPAVLAVLLHNQGTIHARAGNAGAAVLAFRGALEIDSTLWDTRSQLAATLARARRFGDAAEEYERVVGQRPRDLAARLALGTSLVLSESYTRARSALEAALEEFPGQPDLTLALAKLLATCPQSDVRDGPRALALALAAWERTQGLEQAETVAMAQAEVGAFDEAVRWQREVVARAEHIGRPELLALFRGNLARYERREPVRAPWRLGS